MSKQINPRFNKKHIVAIVYMRQHGRLFIDGKMCYCSWDINGESFHVYDMMKLIKENLPDVRLGDIEIKRYILKSDTELPILDFKSLDLSLFDEED